MTPGQSAACAGRITEALLRLSEETLSRIPSFRGGTCLGFYNIWAPGPAAWFQDDLSVLFSPEQYRKVCGDGLRALLSSVPFSMFHLHPASFHHLDTLLEIAGLRALQVNRDVGGPSIRGMLPILKRIQERKSLVIQGILDEDDVSCIVGELEPRGLHFTAMVADIREAERMRASFARKYGW